MRADQAAGRPRVSSGRYREKVRWDTVRFGSHCVDCYPGNCVFRVYVRDGKIVREEQAGAFPVIEPGVPDMNPMGCQKGVAWSRLADSPERLLYPLRRAGKRGSGKWKRVTWDEALTSVAGAIVDAIDELGPESVVQVGGANASTLGLLGRGRLGSLLGFLTLDMNGEITDFAAGHYLTFGTFDPVSSIDDWYHSNLILIWFANPANTRIPHQHYITEARYKGAKVVTIAPDYSPSAVHADYHLAVRPGTDAALALGMCQVIISERLYDAGFASEQTDLPLLVRKDTGRYLRQSDLRDGGREDRFSVLDRISGEVRDVPPGTLEQAPVRPDLEGGARDRAGRRRYR